MKTSTSLYLQQLQEKLAQAKITINNKFTPESQRIEIRNSLAGLINNIQQEQLKISDQKANKNI